MPKSTAPSLPIREFEAPLEKKAKIPACFGSEILRKGAAAGEGNPEAPRHQKITTASAAPCSPQNRGTPGPAPPSSTLRDRQNTCRPGSNRFRRTAAPDGCFPRPDSPAVLRYRDPAGTRAPAQGCC